MAGVRARKQSMIDGLHLVHAANFAKSGAEFVNGRGRFIAEKTVEVALRAGGTRVLKGEQVFLDTGSRATQDDAPGLKVAAPMTHIEALELDVLPEHLIIVGGGYVGLEFAQAIRRFGSRVTVLEHGDRLVRREDRDVSEAMEKLFTDEGIAVLTGVKVTGYEGRSGEHVSVHLERGGMAVTVTGSHLLMAVGRTPNTDNMGLELVGVETTQAGYVRVNERLETTAAGVWAMGDCAGTPHFTHMSYDDFRIVRDNLAGAPRVTTGRQVPSCMFTDPELARVGLNETEAQQQGVAYRLAKIPMVAVLRTRTLSETRGFMKALVGSDDRVLGFTGFGTGMGELLPAIQLAMSAGLPYTALGEFIATHPTLSEGIMALFSAVPKTATSSQSA
jgi:pyruvate/2-oxoglutarate dehydrogenase complex dihydrolipoamide dehydrogenase (E3) component